MRKYLKLTAAAAFMATFPGITSSGVAVADDFADAIMGGEASLSFRYRLEAVDDDAFTKEATASTLRTRLGYKTKSFYDFSALVEIENITEIGADDYNSTTNGKTNLPVIADPEDTAINQLALSYAGIQDTTLTFGRQAVNLDNQRFIGTVGFRQNDQTYDAASFLNKSIADLTLRYYYVWNVNRVFGDDHPLGDLGSNTHIVNASYSGLDGFGTLTGYGYLIDFDDDAAVFGLSSSTFGLRFKGSQPVAEDVKVLYTAEYATQSDYGDNPTSYTADYFTLIGGVSYKAATVKVGYEQLGSDNGGTVAFQTPLATGHRHNGWADKFLSTPVTGLEDIFASASYKIKQPFGAGPVQSLAFLAVYHDLSAEKGSQNFGTEIDARVVAKILDRYSASLKLADYDADNGSGTTDSQKIWLDRKSVV